MVALGVVVARSLQASSVIFAPPGVSAIRAMSIYTDANAEVSVR